MPGGWGLYRHSGRYYPGPAFLANGLRGHLGPEPIGPLLARRQHRRTTSRLLPDVLRLEGEGLTHARIGPRLGATTRAIEHVLARTRRRPS